MGIVSLTGELVRAQMKSKGVKDTHEIKRVVRKATMEDITTWQGARNREEDTLSQARKIVAEHRLEMKLGDVEFQGDGSKCTFYYTAEQRVDFRELVRSLAAAFKVRIEMRQIGARQESARLGGIGVCGRELCCSTWLTDFRSVSTGAARYQQLSLTPQKLAGQCGKLKCCLNFELDQYKEAVAQFPPPSTKLMTRKGKAGHFKTDIFGGKMWFQYFDEPSASPVPIDSTPRQAAAGKVARAVRAAGGRIPAAKGETLPLPRMAKEGAVPAAAARSAATARAPRTHHEDRPSLPSVHRNPRGSVVHDRMRPGPGRRRRGGPRSDGLAGHRYGGHGIPGRPS